MNGPDINVRALVRAGCNAEEIAAFTGMDEASAQEEIEKTPNPDRHHFQFVALGTGVASAFEHALRFSAWVSTLRHPLNAAAIMKRWDVSRATAYRWLAAWKAVHGGGA